MLEANLVRAIRAAIRKRWPRAWIYKTHDASRAGVPDLIVCLDGQFVAMEVKRPGGMVTALQFATLDDIDRAGGVAHVVYSVQEAIEICEMAEDV